MTSLQCIVFRGYSTVQYSTVKVQCSPLISAVLYSKIIKSMYIICFHEGRPLPIETPKEQIPIKILNVTGGLWNSLKKCCIDCAQLELFLQPVCVKYIRFPGCTSCVVVHCGGSFLWIIFHWVSLGFVWLHSVSYKMDDTNEWHQYIQSVHMYEGGCPWRLNITARLNIKR